MPRYSDPQHPQWGPSPVSPAPQHAAGTTYPKRPPWGLILIVGLLVGAVILGVGGVVARQTNALPAGIPLVGKDTGIAACEAISKQAANGSGESSPAIAVGGGTEAAKLRKVFSGSRYAEIRDPGTRFVDLVTQLDSMGEDAGLAALPLVGPLTESYAALAGGCAEHGYTLPNLFGK